MVGVAKNQVRESNDVAIEIRMKLQDKKKKRSYTAWCEFLFKQLQEYGQFLCGWRVAIAVVFGIIFVTFVSFHVGGMAQWQSIMGPEDVEWPYTMNLMHRQNWLSFLQEDAAKKGRESLSERNQSTAVTAAEGQEMKKTMQKADKNGKALEAQKEQEQAETSNTTSMSAGNTATEVVRGGDCDKFGARSWGAKEQNGEGLRVKATAEGYIGAKWCGTINKDLKTESVSSADKFDHGKVHRLSVSSPAAPFGAAGSNSLTPGPTLSHSASAPSLDSAYCPVGFRCCNPEYEYGCVWEGVDASTKKEETIRFLNTVFFHSKESGMQSVDKIGKVLIGDSIAVLKGTYLDVVWKMLVSDWKQNVQQIVEDRKNELKGQSGSFTSAGRASLKALQKKEKDPAYPWTFEKVRLSDIAGKVVGLTLGTDSAKELIEKRKTAEILANVLQKTLREHVSREFRRRSDEEEGHLIQALWDKFRKRLPVQLTMEFYSRSSPAMKLWSKNVENDGQFKDEAVQTIYSGFGTPYKAYNGPSSGSWSKAPGEGIDPDDLETDSFWVWRGVLRKLGDLFPGYNSAVENEQPHDELSENEVSDALKKFGGLETPERQRAAGMLIGSLAVAAGKQQQTKIDTFKKANAGWREDFEKFGKRLATIVTMIFFDESVIAKITEVVNEKTSFYKERVVRAASNLDAAVLDSKTAKDFVRVEQDKELAQEGVDKQSVNDKWAQKEKDMKESLIWANEELLKKRLEYFQVVFEKLSMAFFSSYNVDFTARINLFDRDDKVLKARETLLSIIEANSLEAIVYTVHKA